MKKSELIHRIEILRQWGHQEVDDGTAIGRIETLLKLKRNYQDLIDGGIYEED